MIKKSISSREPYGQLAGMLSNSADYFFISLSGSTGVPFL